MVVGVIGIGLCVLYVCVIGWVGFLFVGGVGMDFGLVWCVVVWLGFVVGVGWCVGMVYLCVDW